MEFFRGSVNSAYVHASKLIGLEAFTIQVLHLKASNSLQFISKVSINLYNLRLSQTSYLKYFPYLQSLKNKDYKEFPSYNLCVYKWKRKVWFNERITSFSHKGNWIHNDKLNHDRRILFQFEFNWAFYSLRRKLNCCWLLGIIGSPLATVRSLFGLVHAMVMLIFWIVRSPFGVVSLPFNSRYL